MSLPMKHRPYTAIARADFESQVVGKPVFTIARWGNLKKLGQELRLCPHHVIAKVGADEHGRIRFLATQGFCYNSTIVHLQLDLEGVRASKGSYIKPLSLACQGQLFGISDEAFCNNHNRYTDDTFLRKYCKKIHRAWVVNSMNGFADYHCGYFQGRNVLGFGTLHFRKDMSVIGLVACAKKYRRKGIGSKIVQALITAALHHGSQKIVVKTQGTNFSAVNLYLKSGFRIVDAEATFYRVKQ